MDEFSDEEESSAVKGMVTPIMTPTTRSRASAAPIQNLLPFLPKGEGAVFWS
jgi:hypothetical protein